MRIVIVGGGVVGFSLAEQLRYEHHDVSLIEKESRICQNVADRIDIKTVCGNGCSPRILEAGGIKGADMVLAVTPADELNITVCAIAKQYDVEARIARIRSNEFRGVDAAIDIGEMGVTLVIDPESVVVDSILHFIETPGATDATNFQNGNVLMRGYQVTEDMSLANRPVKDIRKDSGDQPLLFVAAIKEGQAVIPDGEYIVEPGDIIFGIFPKSSIDAYLPLFNKSRKDINNVIVTGDNLVAIQLAEAARSIVDKVVLVDPDADHAKHAADILNHIEIVHGDCTDSAILNEVYVRNADFFIAAAAEAEYNVMSALLAKAEGASEVLAVASELRHDKLFTSIGIDHVIHPRLAIAREILEAINRGQIGRVVRIRDLDIEAIRIIAEENSPITGRPLQHIRRKIQKGSIIGAILRADDMIIPGGDTVIEPGDQMIVITYTRHVSRLKKLFKSR
jgi:trk system potassium uptake protein TrkA